MSDRLMLFLIVQYAALAGVCAWERLWMRSLYWIGAVLITVAVRGMR